MRRETFMARGGYLTTFSQRRRAKAYRENRKANRECINGATHERPRGDEIRCEPCKATHRKSA